MVYLRLKIPLNTHKHTHLVTISINARSSLSTLANLPTLGISTLLAEIIIKFIRDWRDIPFPAYRKERRKEKKYDAFGFARMTLIYFAFHLM